MIEEHEEFDLVAYDANKEYSLKKTSDGLSVDYWNFVDDFSNIKSWIVEVMKTKDKFLEVFGKDLITQVRDQVYGKMLRAVGGAGKSTSSIEMHERWEKFTPQEQEIIKKIVLYNIDATLHYFLFLIQQGDADDTGIDLIQRTPTQEFSLRDTSDGLCGELYTEDGWIEKFSKYPPSMK